MGRAIVVVGDSGYRGDMLSMLRTRKWIALTLLALLVMAGFGLLSHWQWERAQRDMISSQPVVPLDQVLNSSGTLAVADYGRRVQVIGVFAADHQVLVRRDASTYVVVTPLTTPSGSVVAVARGTATGPADPAIQQVPEGSVTVIGTAQPFDGDPGTASNLPPGQVSVLTASAVGVDGLVGGWVAQAPATDGLSETTVAYGPTAGTGLRAQNVTYAIQWILFAGCVVFFWWRLLRDDVNDQRERLATQSGQGGSNLTATAEPADQVTQSGPNPTRKKVY